MKYPKEHPIDIKYFSINCHSCGVKLIRRKGITSAICFDCRAKKSRERNITKKLKALFKKPLNMKMDGKVRVSNKTTPKLDHRPTPAP